VHSSFKNTWRPYDDPVWFGTPSGLCGCLAVSRDVSNWAVKTILCLKQSVHVQFVKHVAGSNSVPVILPDHFVTSARSSVKEMTGAWVGTWLFLHH